MSKKLPLRVCIAITTYNSEAYIAKLLSYAVAQDVSQIYVLDDASTDNTVAIAKQFDKVEVIAGNSNPGPTGNRNRILGHDIGDILVFLDDDVIPRGGDLIATIKQYFRNPRLAILGMAIYDAKGKQLWFGNNFESNPLFFWARRPFITHLTAEERQQSYIAVQWVLEAASAVRSEVFVQLGGFDERFKRYQEGPDLCRRARMLGYEVGFTHDVQFDHPKPLSVFHPSHAGRYIRSGILWHSMHRGKIKETPVGPQ